VRDPDVVFREDQAVEYFVRNELHLLDLGEARDKIRDALKNTVPIETASSMKEAVKSGYSRAKPGEVVLLAPACTSFDMFQNFEERGEVFKREVLNLEKELKEKRTT